MKHWICKALGHRWDWPDIIVTLLPEGLRFLPQWRSCARCGQREQDVDKRGQIVVIPSFQGDIQGFKNQANRKYGSIGEQVKKEMGWE